MDTNQLDGYNIRTVRGLFLSDSWSGFNKNGIYVESGQAITITGSKFYNNFDAGINLDQVKQVKLNGNHVVMSNRLSLSVPAGQACASSVYLSENARKVNIVGNVIDNTDVLTPNANETTQTKCYIEIRPGATYNVDAGSNLLGDDVYPFKLPGDNGCDTHASYQQICPFR